VTRQIEPAKRGEISRVLTFLAMVFLSVCCLAQEPPPSSSESEIYYQLGKKELAAGNKDAAEKALRFALEADPPNVDAGLNLGRLLFDAKRYREAYALFSDLMKTRGDRIEVPLWLGVCAWHVERNEEALKLLSPLVSSEDKEIASLARIYASMASISLGRPQEAKTFVNGLSGEASEIGGLASHIKSALEAEIRNKGSGATAKAGGVVLSVGQDSSISGLANIDEPSGTSSAFGELGVTFVATRDIGAGKDRELMFVLLADGRYYPSAEEFSVLTAGAEIGVETGPGRLSLAETLSYEHSGIHRADTALSYSALEKEAVNPDAEWPLWSLSAHYARYTPESSEKYGGWGVGVSVSPVADGDVGAVNFSVQSYSARDDTLSYVAVSANEKIPVCRKVALLLGWEVRAFPDGGPSESTRHDVLLSLGFNGVLYEDAAKKLEIGAKGETNKSSVDTASYDRLTSWLSATFLF